MKRIMICCALALCLALTACAPALPPQPTLEELLAEVNAAHQAVQRPEVDAEQYLREGPDQETVARFTEGELTAFNSDAELTAALRRAADRPLRRRQHPDPDRRAVPEVQRGDRCGQRHRVL